MINSSDAKMAGLCLHRVGNKMNEEDLILSEAVINIQNEDTEENLKKYFFNAFKEPSFYKFKEVDGDLEANPMFQWAKEIFAQEVDLIDHSRNIASLLYDQSMNRNIKSGDLFVAHYFDVLIADELVSAIAIFKSENKNTFLKINQEANKFSIVNEEGIALNKIDKACIIFDTDQSDGYKICVTDKSNASEAQYWMENFLNVQICENDYQLTKNYIDLTQSFVKERMHPIYETDKIEEAEVLLKSKAFFNSAETFNEENYAADVFENQEIQADFHEYVNDYKEETALQLKSDFDISQEALDKKSNVFKSVIKLDKNFHIYVHGDRNKIEKGVDQSGRKYYKVFYETEQ